MRTSESGSHSGLSLLRQSSGEGSLSEATTRQMMVASLIALCGGGGDQGCGLGLGLGGLG